MSASRLGLLAHSLPSTRPAMCKYPEIIISLACTLVDVTSSVAYRCSGSMFAETFQIVSVCKYSPQLVLHIPFEDVATTRLTLKAHIMQVTAFI